MNIGLTEYFFPSFARQPTIIYILSKILKRRTIPSPHEFTEMHLCSYLLVLRLWLKWQLQFDDHDQLAIREFIIYKHDFCKMQFIIIFSPGQRQASKIMG